MKHDPTFYRALVDSSEWQAWVRQNELYPQWDVHESMDTGWLSPQHFAAFMKFSVHQHAIAQLIKFRDNITFNQNQFNALIDQFTL